MAFNKQMYKVEFTEECFEDIIEIYEYINNKLKENSAAIRLISKIKLKILNLSDFPELYVEISDLNNLKRKYHRIVIKNYVVLYTIDYKNKKVFISHMYYGRRNYINNLLFKRFYK